MARTDRTGTRPLACTQSRRHVYKGRTLRSTVSPFYLQGRLIWRSIMGSNGLPIVGSRSAG